MAIVGYSELAKKARETLFMIAHSEFGRACIV